MSTPCELILFTHTKSKADDIANAILSETKRLEKKYSYYREDSILSKINNRIILNIDSETKNILQRAKKYYNITNGVFDITIATIKELYCNISNEKELQNRKLFFKEFIGCEHFSIKRDKIIFDNPYTKIDLGGFVKEYAVDRAIMILKKNKIVSALINYGGDIYALGRKPDDTKFSIGIKNPLNQKEFISNVLLENEALTTSASYERSYKVGSKEYSHILSKIDYEDSPNSVSVISDNCVESGVFSTSMMLDKNIETKNRVIIF